ncbi:MAG: L,D-transpeptidase [Hyphomicrobiaceae bacterium]
MRRWMFLIVLVAGFATGVVAANASEVVPPPVLSPNAIEKRDTLIRSFGQPGLEYLETLKGRKGFKAPSELDPRFTMAFYVNASGRGPQAQRMWMLQRDKIGGTWKLGMWDQRYWKRKGLPASVRPPYSWLVSTGRKYRGDRKSGPTPSGVYTIDERKYRMARGYTVPGMINVTYLDLHYSGGRRSGVAFHGTTRGKYRRLGSIDSHGCIRMTQPNALALINRMQGSDGFFSDEMRWGEVPRFWKSERGNRRFGYSRDGATHQLPEKFVSAGYEMRHSTDETRFPRVLTKTGYRTVVVIFRD